ncbi:aldo-keto reductase family 1 member A1-A-like, partial [Camellia sinensis]|uniref:aldo-keto reductase family 1 member A1-A-like n=1 Tax=Camellia sinensis TaxID=4442 RepID=UPI0010361FCC
AVKKDSSFASKVKRVVILGGSFFALGNVNPAAEANMENSVRVSLKNLGVSYLDLYLMYGPESSAFGDATDPPTKLGSEYRQFLNRFKTTWKAMEGLVELGLVRAIGISHFNIEQIKELLKFAKMVPVVNQVNSLFLDF